MSTLETVLIEISGSNKWPRWMIYQIRRRRYWGGRRWWKERRNGEVWDDQAKAMATRSIVCIIGNAIKEED